MSERRPFRVGVVIATRGRPEIVSLLVKELARQTVPPDSTIIAVSDARDAPGVSDGSVAVVSSAAGLTIQRNAGLYALGNAVDIVVFFDDDFFPSRYWIENACALFASADDIVCVTGAMLADGSKTAGVTWSEAAQIVQQADGAPRKTLSPVKEDFPPCGCNMAFRRSAIGDLRFDERLVLYAWQEDTDFGAGMAARGRCVFSADLLGVHLGTKGGRTSGRRLGYSQIVNPRYLVAKGTMRPQRALELAGRNFIMNTLRAFYSEPYIDRRGRLHGNLIGLWDLATGRWRPERATEL
jgi:GT2 family glycosyltransferase